MENGSYVYDKSRDNGLRYLAGEAFRRSKELAIAKELGVILENPIKPNLLSYIIRGSQSVCWR